MTTRVINYGKAVASVFDALISAEIDKEEWLGGFVCTGSLIIYKADDRYPEERIYRLLAEALDYEQFEAFKGELTDTVGHFDDTERENERTVEDFITAGEMMGMPPDEMSEDVAKIIRALKNGEEIKPPRMEDVWDLPETHDWSRD